MLLIRRSLILYEMIALHTSIEQGSWKIARLESVLIHRSIILYFCNLVHVSLPVELCVELHEIAVLLYNYRIHGKKIRHKNTRHAHFLLLCSGIRSDLHGAGGRSLWKRSLRGDRI